MSVGVDNEPLLAQSVEQWRDVVAYHGDGRPVPVRQHPGEAVEVGVVGEECPHIGRRPADDDGFATGPCDHEDVVDSTPHDVNGPAHEALQRVVGVPSR